MLGDYIFDFLKYINALTKIKGVFRNEKIRGNRHWV